MNMEYDLYILAELSYKKEHSDLSDEELFPSNWYSIKDYRFKTLIIDEALEKNILIKDTKKYIEALEGSK